MPKLNLGRVKGDKGDSFTFDDFTPDQLDGITPKMLLGNVTTLNPDENATVDMRKDGLKNYVDFGIPRGKNGAEIKNISAENVVMANGTTLESTMTVVNEDVDANTDEINKIKTPTFTDTVGTYTTLNAANTAAETSSNAIKSKVSIFTTLSNIKKSFSAIVQGLKILGTNVGMIQGITSDLNSESDYIAASSKALATLNGNLFWKQISECTGGQSIDISQFKKAREFLCLFAFGYYRATINIPNFYLDPTAGAYYYGGASNGSDNIYAVCKFTDASATFVAFSKAGQDLSGGVMIVYYR